MTKGISRKERKARKEKIINDFVKELSTIFISMVEREESTQNIRKALIKTLFDRIDKNPQDKHVYQEGVRRFMYLLDKGTHKVETEVAHVR